MAKLQYDLLFKILVIGDSGVGKTSIMQRYCDLDFSSDYISTVGVDFKPKMLEVGEKRIKLQIWDTAGQERFMNITAAYFRNTTAVLIVYDVNNRVSLERVQMWYSEVKEKTGKNTPVTVIVGNKKEGDVEPVVKITEAQEVGKKIGGVKVMECSAKEGVGITEIFDYVVEEVLKNMENVPPLDDERDVQLNNEQTKKGCC
ncbi:hypothetical protein EIN_117950 [Entamoeba invadens IP1]|uniref:Uncharacterized protein n=1 Tax=Entamoeba invadens IP1 TaxID=370355 RepID=L7FNM7_ENTIV|nr:hypothetical protein EIN_117950 [Entamoeba invadens IP1]ELP92221.1 hypothetical protein EIN_117950 [Entamoeba invadens IP1]|eukprot:XP_004258992.1 hypothetical protein EIN_117950 [Entamoeba invadens IP1]